MEQNNEYRKESLENWKRHADKAESDGKDATAEKRTSLGLLFGSVAIAVGSFKFLPESSQDIVLMGGTAIAGMGITIAYATNRLFSAKRAFYKAVNVYCNKQYKDILNNKEGSLGGEHKSYEDVKKIVGKTFNKKDVFKKSEYRLNQATIIGTFAAATTVWYLSSKSINDIVIIGRQNEIEMIIDNSTSPQAMDVPPKQPVLVLPH